MLVVENTGADTLESDAVMISGAQVSEFSIEMSGPEVAVQKGRFSASSGK